MSAVNERLQPIRDLMKAKSLDSFVLRRNPNLAWAIAGRAHVASTTDAACFDLIISHDSVIAITNVIEAPRLIAEEFPPEVAVKTVDWFASRDVLLPKGSNVGSDSPGGERIDLGIDVEMFRASLIESDLSRYKVICEDAAIAFGNAMKQIKNTDREIDVAGLITRALWQSDLEIAFLGVAGEVRVQKYRHPLPTNAVVGNRVSASICAKRKGLIASVTRIVTFGAPNPGFVKEYESIFKVEGAMLDATLVGNPFSAPIEAAIAAYPRHGFAVDEWSRHHQGGPTGFLPRDWPAHQGSMRLIAAHQPISWNPTGKGWKAEDTLVTTDSGVKILSNDPAWPVFEVNGRTRAFLLQR